MDVIVGRAVDDQQPRAPVVEHPREIDRRIVVVACGVVLRKVVVDLGVDRVVITPRGDGSHGDGHFEQPEALHRTAQGHESAVGPAVDADARRVDPGLRRHVAGGRKLVLDLQRPQASVGEFLELFAPESRAAAVGADHDVAFVGEGVLPVQRPAVAHGLRAGTRILGQQYGVTLRGIEAAGLDHIGVERVAALGREGEELLHGAVGGGQFFAQAATVGQRADGFPGGVADLRDVGGRGVGKGGDEVFHPGARGCGVVALARGETLFVLAVEAHAVQVAAQRRGLGREEPHAPAVGSHELGHLPRAFGHLFEDAPAEAVQVEVHEARVALLPHEETVAVDEGHGPVVHALDILLRPLLVDRALRSVGFADDHLEGVLAAVEAVVPRPSVGRPADAGNVLVGLLARVDALPGAGLEVGDPELDHGVALPGLGVFE